VLKVLQHFHQHGPDDIGQVMEWCMENSERPKEEIEEILAKFLTSHLREIEAKQNEPNQSKLASQKSTTTSEKSKTAFVKVSMLFNFFCCIDPQSKYASVCPWQVILHQYKTRTFSVKFSRQVRYLQGRLAAYQQNGTLEGTSLLEGVR
jgi:hypothetical protein